MTFYDGMGDQKRTSSASFPPEALEEFRSAGATLSEVFALTPAREATAIVNGQSEPATVVCVSGNYFSVLGVHSTVGREITPEDDRPTADPGVVLSHSFWKTRLAVGEELKVRFNGATLLRREPEQRYMIPQPSF